MQLQWKQSVDKIKASFHIYVVVIKTEQYNPASSIILHGEEGIKNYCVIGNINSLIWLFMMQCIPVPVSAALNGSHLAVKILAAARENLAKIERNYLSSNEEEDAATELNLPL